MLQEMLFCTFQNVGMLKAKGVRLRVIEPEIVRDFLELSPHKRIVQVKTGCRPEITRVIGPQLVAVAVVLLTVRNV